MSNSESDEGESSSQAVIPRSEEALTLRSFSGDEQVEQIAFSQDVELFVSGAFNPYCGNSFERNWCCVGGELKQNKLG